MVAPLGTSTTYERASPIRAMTTPSSIAPHVIAVNEKSAKIGTKALVNGGGPPS